MKIKLYKNEDFMKIFVPDYYNKFKCIADKCSDSCCIGWAIEIDGATAEKYRCLEGDRKDELMATLDTSDGLCFKCDSSGRCKNLDQRGLCQIITRLGEDYLCQICRDHPRYFNCYHGRCEGGLGLACEVAADLVLSIDSLPEITTAESDDFVYLGEENHRFAFLARDYFLSLLFDEGSTMEHRIGRLWSLSFAADEALFDIICGTLDDDAPAEGLLSEIPEMPFDLSAFIKENLPIFRDLEVLTPDFSDRMDAAIEKATSTDGFIKFLGENSAYLRNLTYYFIHRYLVSDDICLSDNMTLAVSCALAVMSLVYASQDRTHAAFITEAKDFSKNIEYSTENIENLLEKIMF